MATFSPTCYEAWRRTVPWSNDEIAAQLEADAVVCEKSARSAGRGRFLRWRAGQVRAM